MLSFINVYTILNALFITYRIIHDIATATPLTTACRNR